MATLSNYIKLTKSQYQTLISQGYIIVNGTRYDYDANAIYLVEDNAEYVDLTSSQTIRGQKTFEQIKVGDANNDGILHLYDGANGGYANIQSFDDSFSFNDYDGNTIRINPSDNELVTRDDYYISFPQDDGTFALTKNYYDKTASDGRYVRYDTNAQGLTDTQKSNARTNIGAGTSSFSGNYNDLTNKPTIPTVNNATLTITQNSTSIGTFTANASSNVTIDVVTSQVYRYI